MSVHVEIINSAIAILEQVTELKGARFQVRKRPLILDDHDTAPLVCLSPEKEVIAGEQFDDNVWIDYPVVVLYCRSLASHVGNVNEALSQLAVREAIRKALWRPLLFGSDTVFDCNYDPDPPFDPAALDDAYDVSVQLFTFRTSEPRNY